MRPLVCILLLFVYRQDQKLPVPDPADQKRAEAEIRSVFKEDFAKKTREAKRALAVRLLTEAGDAKNTPASRYVVLLLSRDLAVEGLDVGTIIASIDQLGKLYDVAKPPLTGASFTSSSNALKISALNGAQKFASTPEDSALLGDAYLKVAEDSLKERIFDDALAVAQAAEKYAKSAKATSIAERAAVLIKEVPELKKEDDQFGNAITDKADDPAAKLVKGRYSLFVVGDDKAGIEHLLGCSDEGLKSVAKLEAAKPTTADAMVDIAEAWLTLSTKEESSLQKRRYRGRARQWFDDAMKNAGGITKAKIEKRLAELGKSDGPPAAAFTKGLVGQWSFDEGKGSALTDLSGKGNHGSIYGGTKWVPGFSGAAVSLDGTSGYVSLGVAGFPAVDAPQSICWALNLPSIPDGNNMVFALADVSSGISIYSVFLKKKLGIYHWGPIQLVAADAPAAGQWHHFVYTFDGKTHRLYIDGTLKDSSTVKPQSGVPKRFEFGRWGGGEGGGTPREYLTGMIDEVRVYDRALSDQEVQALARKRK